MLRIGSVWMDFGWHRVKAITFITVPRVLWRVLAFSGLERGLGLRKDFKDHAYTADMLSTSQSMNKAYGYLWWLNGKDRYMAPGSQIIFSGTETFTPADLIRPG